MRGLAFFVALSRMNGGLILEVATSYSSIHLRKLLFFEEERGQPEENTRNSEQFPGEYHIKKGRGVPLPSRPPVINRVVNILVFSGVSPEGNPPFWSPSSVPGVDSNWTKGEERNSEDEYEGIMLE